MYLITFHSQFDSNLFFKKMREHGTVRRKPVPRQLSSACGTCCVFEPDDPCSGLALLPDQAFEKIYWIKDGNNYELLYENE